MTVPYTFSGQSGAIPLSELDANFASVPNFANVANTVTANAQPNITSVGTLTSLTVTGNIITNILLQNAPFISLGANAGFSSQTDIIAIGNAAAGNNNQQDYGIAIGSQAGYNLQGANAISIGGFAGANNQSSEAVAIGFRAGNYYQGGNAVAIGRNSGNINQGANAVSVGRNSGNISQGTEAVAVGHSAGNTVQGIGAVAIGWQAGSQNQQDYAIAIGAYAGNLNQGSNSVAIGSFAGYPNLANNAIVINGDDTSLSANASGLYISPIRGDGNLNQSLFYNTTSKEITYSTAYGNANVNAYMVAYLPTNTSNVSGNYFIGNGSQLTGIVASEISGNLSTTGNIIAGNISAIENIYFGNTIFGNTLYLYDGSNTSAYAVAIGFNAGNSNQGNNAISIGHNSGNTSQGAHAIAIGRSSGNTQQGAYAVAIGAYSGNNYQGSNSVAIGSFAGYPAIANSAIVINGDTTPLNGPTTGLFISPISNNIGNVGNILCYDITTKEITYSSNISTTGNITANNIISNNITSSATINLKAVNLVEVTQSLFRLANFTTTQAANLTPQQGDMIYNNTVGNVQIYNGTKWGNVVVS
jgi:hypothetical protein